MTTHTAATGTALQLCTLAVGMATISLSRPDKHRPWRPGRRSSCAA
ncbi:MAG: hypothetical protein QE285_17630 [Aquabacterium sp.]|nr:hypothetical protein [Aquabacterium sp.]